MRTILPHICKPYPQVDLEETHDGDVGCVKDHVEDVDGDEAEVHQGEVAKGGGSPDPACPAHWGEGIGRICHALRRSVGPRSQEGTPEVAGGDRDINIAILHHTA